VNVCGANGFGVEKVVTTDGHVAISEIEVGDTVLAYNEATGETGEYLVIATIAHHDPTVVYLTISGETLTTIAEHPFYTTDGEWIDAGELTHGAEIVALDGTFGTVEAVTVAADAQPMYNLTVDTAHTFFVGDGQWLVHNTNGKCVPEFIFEAELRYGVDYPVRVTRQVDKVKLRHAHNRQANEQLYNFLAEDSVASNAFKDLYPDIYNQVKPSGRNSVFSRNSPNGWIWHHDPYNPGKMQLLTVADHNTFRKQLHIQPKNRGGFEIWAIQSED
jgi:hypothetical protein